MHRTICLFLAFVVAIASALPYAGALPVPPPDLRSPVTYVLATLSGSAVGMFRDPFAWVSLVLIAAISIRHPRLGLLAAVAAAILGGLMVWSWQDEIGFPVFSRLVSGARKAALLYLIAAPIAGIIGLFVPRSEPEPPASPAT
ncbi:hypothetical protein [Microvirga sp. 17 mud 1-3]|uniref:hypothetical protein n=1 Tax=Microvirga sp. 17 mud 1-3 TaxID=2082949 RepID=UPI000D6BC8B3|nr:hypothetical protein [Microvirga sp. 17 mud 1-3]AWM88269.1 hypothetical protein C4E04_16980 [Microvirga sp. 17 mud 1-3]